MRKISTPVSHPESVSFHGDRRLEGKAAFPDLDAIDWKKQADIDVHSDFMAFVMGYGLHPRKDGKSVYDEDKARVCMVLNGIIDIRIAPAWALKTL